MTDKSNIMEFSKQAWNLTDYEEWLEYDTGTGEAFGLKDFTIRSLSNGLPEGAAPFLSFYSKNGMLKLETLKDLYGFEDEAADYISFGHDGSGNELCIDKTANDRIVLFDHDDEFEMVTVNNNLSDFLYCILAYRDFIAYVRKTYGKDGFIEDKCSPEDVEMLMENMKKTDADLFINSLFWKQEIRDFMDK
jgi:hypothetical protein